MGRLKHAARAMRRRVEAAGGTPEQPLFTAVTAGWGRKRHERGAVVQEQAAVVEVIATFVGVLGRLEAGQPANRPGLHPGRSTVSGIGAEV